MLIHSIVPSLLELRSVFLHLSLILLLCTAVFYSCMSQVPCYFTLRVTSICVMHASTMQIHSYVQLYSCTAVPCGDTATFRRQIPYPDTVLGHTKLYYHLVPSIGTVLDTYQGTAVRPAYSCMFVC